MKSMTELIKRQAELDAEKLRFMLLKLRDSERLEVIDSMKFCQHCGSDTADKPCFCMRDE